MILWDKKWSLAAVGVVALGGLLAIGVAPAQASEDPADQSAETTIVTNVTPGTSKTVELSGAEGTLTVELGEPDVVTAEQIRSDPGLTESQKNEIVAATAVATTSSNHWSQFVTGAVYTQTQNGTFYYNGSRVWVTQTYAGTTGSHACFTNYQAFGWEVKNIQKSDSGSTTARNLYCGWNVKQGPYPLETSYSMTATVKPNGTISGAGATVG